MCSSRRQRRAQRGFTVVEFMLALGVGTVFIIVMDTAAFSMQRIYQLQLEDTEMHQNGRAAIEIIKRHLRNAAYGFNTDQLPPSSVVPHIGNCFDTIDPTLSTFDCDGVDVLGTDRFRVAFGEGEGFSTDLTTQPGNSLIRVGPKPGPNPAGHPLPLNTKVIVSGLCKCPPDDGCIGGIQANGPRTTTDIITITADNPDGQWWHKYNFDRSEASCDYNDGFNFGSYQMVDFYIDSASIPGTPVLRMRRDQTADPSTGDIVAYDIEDLQVQYGIDTGDGVDTTPDNFVDLWADSLSGGCNGGAFTEGECWARTIGVRVSVVARTRREFADGPRWTGGANTPFNNPIAGGDRYKRSVYRATVALRNNVLPTSP